MSLPRSSVRFGRLRILRLPLGGRICLCCTHLICLRLLCRGSLPPGDHHGANGRFFCARFQAGTAGGAVPLDQLQRRITALEQHVADLPDQPDECSQEVDAAGRQSGTRPPPQPGNGDPHCPRCVSAGVRRHGRGCRPRVRLIECAGRSRSPCPSAVRAAPFGRSGTKRWRGR
ncbi:hypothetical protein SAFG77S_00858 [Streptomyces afghaniensis]